MDIPTPPPSPALLDEAGAMDDGSLPDDGSLTLHTDLLGDLQVPDGASRRAELEALSVRAALYATRARGDGTRRVYRSA